MPTNDDVTGIAIRYLCWQCGLEWLEAKVEGVDYLSARAISLDGMAAYGALYECIAILTLRVD